MDTITLGRSGLTVSVMGLGCGGHSRVGLSTGRSAEESVSLIRRAVESGVTFVDTAEAYETEPLVGRAIAGLRERVVLSTKKSVGPELDEAGLRRGLEVSLGRLGTDHVDVYHLHGVSPEHYASRARRFVPVLRKLKEEGKIRTIGITEHFGSDTRHVM